MARTFNGTTDRADNTASAPATAAPITLVAMVRPASLPAAQNKVLSISTAGVAGSTYHAFELGIVSTGVARAATVVGAGNSVGDSTATVTLSTWQLIIAEFASSTSRRAAVGSSFGSAETTSRVPSGVDRVAIGCRPTNTAANFYAGDTEWCAAWNVVLTQAEYDALAAGVPPWRVRPTALIGCWPMWGVHTTEIDLSTGRRNLTLTGTSRAATGAPVLQWRPRFSQFTPPIASVLVTATASLNAALQKALTATGSLNAAIQRNSITLTASLNAGIAVRRTLTASINAALQKALTQTASLNSALQKNIAATAALDAGLARAFSLGAQLDVAIQQAHAIVAGLDAVIQPIPVARPGQEAKIDDRGGAYFVGRTNRSFKMPPRNRTFRVQ